MTPPNGPKTNDGHAAAVFNASSKAPVNITKPTNTGDKMIQSSNEISTSAHTKPANLKETPISTLISLSDQTPAQTDGMERKAMDDGETTGEQLDLAAYQSFKPFSINIKTLTGREVPIDVTNSTDIATIKEMIEELVGLPANQQRLLFAGEVLESGRIIGSYDVWPGVELYLAICLHDGKMIRSGI